MFGLELKKRRVGSIEENGMFIFGNDLYRVLPEPTGLDYDEMAGKMMVQKIAAGWTNNPTNRWQFGEYSVETFQIDCVVAELVFKSFSEDFRARGKVYVALSSDMKIFYGTKKGGES